MPIFRISSMISLVTDPSVADQGNKPLSALNTRGWYKTLLSLDGSGESGLKTMPRCDKSLYGRALYCCLFIYIFLLV